MNRKSLIGPVCIWALMFGIACDDDKDDHDKDSGDPGSTDEEPTYAELSAPLFSIEELMEVKINIDESEWDALRYDAPGLEHFSEACPAGPRPRSFEWHAAAVSVNGESFGEIEIRKKGLMGSMYSYRPSLKLRFADDHRPGGIRRMTLNNAFSDKSHAVECIVYDLFQKAGITAPRCGLARVTINGEFLGVYTHIEEIKKPMLRMHYGESVDKQDLFEITMADFTDDHLVMFEPKWSLEEGEAVDLSGLRAVSDALALDDEALLPALGELVDLDKFYTFWAMEILTIHEDGYAGNQNNAYLYRNPNTGLFEFIPWGTDGALYAPSDFYGEFTGEYDTMPWSVYAHGALARRLLHHPEGRAAYEARLRGLLDTVFDETAILARLDRIQETVRPHLAGNLIEANAAETAALEATITGHRENILAELDDGLPEWDRPANPLLCADIEHTLEGTLQTELESSDRSIFETGEGAVTDLESGMEMPIVRGIMGRYTDAFDQEMIELQIAMGPIDETHVMLFYMRFPGELFEEGRTLKMDYGEARTEVLEVSMETGEYTVLGFVMTGEMTFEHIGTGDDDALLVSFHAPVGTIRI